MMSLRLLVCWFLFVLLSYAEPLPEGSYVDLVVVPVGPVALAEFEEDTSFLQAIPAKPGAKDEGNSGPTGGGSGVKVKEQDPSEIPPRAVFLKRGESQYFKIPCYFNAITQPVRVPVSDTEINFLVQPANTTETFENLDKVQLPGVGRCLLVLLTKPLNEKKWIRPKVTLLPLPAGEAARLVIANASHGLSCGAVINGSQKILIPPFKHHIWLPAQDMAGGTVGLALAMALNDQQFQPPFLQSNLPLSAATTTLFITYEVTPQESFRCGKYATGSFKQGEFRQATMHPEKDR